MASLVLLDARPSSPGYHHIDIGGHVQCISCRRIIRVARFAWCTTVQYVAHVVFERIGSHACRRHDHYRDFSTFLLGSLTFGSMVARRTTASGCCVDVLGFGRAAQLSLVPLFGHGCMVRAVSLHAISQWVPRHGLFEYFTSHSTRTDHSSHSTQVGDQNHLNKHALLQIHGYPPLVF